MFPDRKRGEVVKRIKALSFNLLQTEKTLSISFLCGSSYTTAPFSTCSSECHSFLPCAMNYHHLLPGGICFAQTLLSVFSLCSWALRSSDLACLEASNKRNSILAKRVSSEIPKTRATNLSVLC